MLSSMTVSALQAPRAPGAERLRLRAFPVCPVSVAAPASAARLSCPTAARRVQLLPPRAAHADFSVTPPPRELALNSLTAVTPLDGRVRVFVCFRTS